MRTACVHANIVKCMTSSCYNDFILFDNYGTMTQIRMCGLIFNWYCHNFYEKYGIYSKEEKA